MSLVILDLSDVIYDNDIKLLVAEELGVGLRGPSDDLDLIDPSVIDVVYSYVIYAVF